MRTSYLFIQLERPSELFPLLDTYNLFPTSWGGGSGNGRLYQGGAVIPANPYHLPHVCLSVAVALLAYFRHSLEI